MTEVVAAADVARCSMCAVLSAAREQQRMREALQVQAELCAKVVEEAAEEANGATRVILHVVAQNLRERFGRGGI
jgi:hypothetical protein